MRTLQFQLRRGTPDDAQTIAALAVQVFLDTYAVDGVRPDLAQEAFDTYSCEAVAGRLGELERSFIVAEQAAAIVGFAELITTPQRAPVAFVVGAQLTRLYVQPRLQGSGIGKSLLLAAEAAASSLGVSVLWLTTWEGNCRARRFYATHGYKDVGSTTYAYQSNVYSDRVLAKHLLSTGEQGSTPEALN